MLSHQLRIVARIRRGSGRGCVFLVFPIDFLLRPSPVCYLEPALLTCAGWLELLHKGDVAPRGCVAAGPLGRVGERGKPSSCCWPPWGIFEPNPFVKAFGKSLKRGTNTAINLIIVFLYFF